MLRLSEQCWSPILTPRAVVNVTTASRRLKNLHCDTALETLKNVFSSTGNPFLTRFTWKLHKQRQNVPTKDYLYRAQNASSTVTAANDQCDTDHQSWNNGDDHFMNLTSWVWSSISIQFIRCRTDSFMDWPFPQRGDCEFEITEHNYASSRSILILTCISTQLLQCRP